MPIHGYPGGVITANPVAPTASVATGVWTTEQQLQAVSQGNWPGYEYPISRSLRFNSADSAYLNRTPASASNRTTWTWSGWVKRGSLGSVQQLFMAGAAGTDYTTLLFNSTDTLCFHNVASSANAGRKFSSAVYRDPAAWYHIVAVWDTTNATAGNRMLVYVNGVSLTAFSPDENPSSSQVGQVNNNAVHTISKNSTSAVQYVDGYLTEVNFIDGQALTPSSFGETDTNTGVWKPKAFSGTYGTNGFYLKFADNSNTTAATLGKDSSGNGNNWTPNNFSVTAGAGNDSLVDSPTSYGTDTGVGGEVRGNYATLNPLQKNSTVTIANGNLDITTSSDNREVLATLSASAGKWYFEVTFTSQTNAEYIGICDTTYTLFDGSWGSQVRAYISNGNKWNGSSSSYGASYTTNDVIGVAYDIDAGTIVFYKNNSSQGTAFTDLNGKSWRPFINNGISNAVSCNFGQRAFAYTAPSGFKALCTQNLPTPTIGATSTTQANDYFDVSIWTGADTGTGRSISGLQFAPDLWWGKSRSNSYYHQIFDAVRGAGSAKALASNDVGAEGIGNGSTYGYLSSFDSTGVTYTRGSGGSGTNPDGYAYYDELNTTYAAWAWNAGGSNATNTAGTITSTVRANTTSGFSIVTYTGTGANATVGHGLGVAPDMVIVKGRNTINLDWVTYHRSLTSASYALFLNATNAQTLGTTYWNSTAPTSTVFSVGADNNTNKSATTYVAYCFDAVAGYSAFGSYVGNGSADGPFVYLGFRPEFVMIKNASATGDWFIYDAVRNTYNVSDNRLKPNLLDAEGTGGSFGPDILSNGFKMRSNFGEMNGSGNTIIYMAFAENPFKYSLAR